MTRNTRDALHVIGWAALFALAYVTYVLIGAVL